LDIFSGLTGMPKAPVIHSSEVISSSSILVKWKAVTMVAKPVILYTLYYNADHEKSPRAVNITVKNSTGNYEYRLLKLNQLTAYSISLSATNIFGEGTVSEPVVEKTSPIGKDKRALLLYQPVINSLWSQTLVVNSGTRTYLVHRLSSGSPSQAKKITMSSFLKNYAIQ
jgi:hypothetical protein